MTLERQRRSSCCFPIRHREFTRRCFMELLRLREVLQRCAQHWIRTDYSAALVAEGLHVSEVVIEGLRLSLRRAAYASRSRLAVSLSRCAGGASLAPCGPRTFTPTPRTTVVLSCTGTSTGCSPPPVFIPHVPLVCRAHPPPPPPPWGLLSTVHRQVLGLGSFLAYPTRMLNTGGP